MANQLVDGVVTVTQLLECELRLNHQSSARWILGHLHLGRTNALDVNVMASTGL